MAVISIMEGLRTISEQMQDKDARSELRAKEGDILQMLRDNPGLGVIARVGFNEPGHLFQGVTFELAKDQSGGFGPSVSGGNIFESIWYPPRAVPKDTPVADSTAIKVNSADEFVANLVGADAFIANDPVQLCETLKSGGPAFSGTVAIHFKGKTFSVPSSVINQMLPGAEGLARSAMNKRLSSLKDGIDQLQTRLDGYMKEGRVRKFLTRSIDLTGHELDAARAHVPAASSYIENRRFGDAQHSIESGEEQINHVWATLFEYATGSKPGIDAPIER
jgi:hypothetical protein